MSETPEYRSWCAMMDRCRSPKHPAWDRYGGRGISVCERWATSFENFLLDMGPRQDGTTLDRYPNNDGNYEPGNCRWATRAEQDSNKSSSALVEYDGRKVSLTELSRLSGVRYSTLLQRHNRGDKGTRLTRTPETPAMAGSHKSKKG